MKSKKIIELIRLIVIIVGIIIGIKFITSIFKSDKDVEKEVKTEVYENTISTLNEKLSDINKKLIKLEKHVKAQKIEQSFYYKNIVPDSLTMEKIENGKKYSYWFFSYEDNGYQDYIVMRMNGSHFNFDEAMKTHRDDGKSKGFGGIVSIRQISYEEFLTTREDRRRKMKEK